MAGPPAGHRLGAGSVKRVDPRPRVRPATRLMFPAAKLGNDSTACQSREQCPRIGLNSADANRIAHLDGHRNNAPVSAYVPQFSVAKRLNPNCNHPDLVDDTRTLLGATGKPWVIENVPGSPLRYPAQLCGLALGLNVKRHRLFEASFLLFGTPCPRGHRGNWITIFGHDGTIRRERKRWVTVFGGGAPKVPDNRRRATMEQRQEAMGIDWMTRYELSLAIPPAYTEFVGRQLIEVVSR